MINLLKLHEAIAVVLFNCKGQSATTEFIAQKINYRGLYKRKDKKPVPDYQILQRVLLSKGKYHHLFVFKRPNIVKLR